MKPNEFTDTFGKYSARASSFLADAARTSRRAFFIFTLFCKAISLHSCKDSDVCEYPAWVIKTTNDNMINFFIAS